MIRKIKKLLLVKFGSWLISQFVIRSEIISRGKSDHGTTFCKLKNGYNVLATVSKTLTPSDNDGCSKSSGMYRDLDSGKVQSIHHDSRHQPEQPQGTVHKTQDKGQTILPQNKSDCPNQ